MPWAGLFMPLQDGSCHGQEGPCPDKMVQVMGKKVHVMGKKGFRCDQA